MVATTAPESSRWAVVELDDRVAVYDRRSGRTHLLDHLSAALLPLLDGGPVDDDVLRARLATGFDLRHDELPLARIQQARAGLIGAGLLEP